MPAKLFTPEQDKRIAIFYKRNFTVQQIADRFGVYKQVVLNSLKRTNTPRRKNWKRASGENNGAWKGGIRMVKGYRHVFKPKHHLARGDGWVAEHRIIAEEIIGRKLKEGEVVHHKDENRVNNDKSNLMVYASNGEHLSNHSKHWKRNKKGKWSKK